MAAVSGMRYAAGKKADGNKYEIRNVPYSQSAVWHVFGTALACSKCLRSVQACPFKGDDESSAMWLEQSESQRFETLA